MRCTEILPGIDLDHKPLGRNVLESVALVFYTDPLDELISRSPAWEGWRYAFNIYLGPTTAPLSG